MGFDQDCKQELTIRPLTQREIESRLQRVVAEVGGWPAEDGGGHGCADPRWITAAELVQRIRPFVNYN